jgi:transcriptional regulator with XRE-family HTH domain/Zn-dependent peptidase ImmA (M78 family)
MLIDKETLRLIFGLKLRSLREDKKLSLKDLAKKTGLSPSYLNEIEKGKKYPKTEKIILLANALEEKYESLISLELKKEFRLLQNLMDRKILKALPFDVFGIPINTLFELIAEEPDKLSAFVGTILEIARAHNIQIDDIFYALLRSYIDMNGNYFLAIEEHAKNFRDKYKLDILISPNELKKSLLKVLESELKVKVIEEELFHNGRKLTKIFYYILDQGRELHISNEIGIEEQIFILAREIGYRVQKLEIRPKSSLIAGLDSFAQLYNHFSASYFASSLLIPEHLIIEDCKNWFNQENWKIEELLTIIHKYNAPTESLFHRITQILPQHFGINHLFFLRYEYDIKQEKYEIARELHLSSLHGPHRIKGHEHYCARWLISKITQSITNSDEKIKLGVQRSHYVDSNQEYLILGAAFKAKNSSEKMTSICLGLLINEDLNQKLKFLSNNQLSSIKVGETCERCSLQDCIDRRSPQDIPLDFF